MWRSGLRICCCHCSSLGGCFGGGLIPGQGNLSSQRFCQVSGSGFHVQRYWGNSLGVQQSLHSNLPERCLPRRAALGPSAWRRHTRLDPCVWSGNGSRGPRSPEQPQPWRWGLGKDQKGRTAPSTGWQPQPPIPPTLKSYGCIPHRHTASGLPAWAWGDPQH